MDTDSQPIEFVTKLSKDSVSTTKPPASQWRACPLSIFTSHSASERVGDNSSTYDGGPKTVAPIMGSEDCGT